jgi:hypothetical protein
VKELKTLLSYFPEIELPVTLTDDSLTHINATNDLMPEALLQEVFVKYEEDISSEFMEIMPCFRIKMLDEKVAAIVYWKGDLLKYEFILLTVNTSGDIIDKRPICGTVIDGDIVKKSVATIDGEFGIHIMAGAYDSSVTSTYDGNASQSFSMELLPTGEIVFMK